MKKKKKQHTILCFENENNKKQKLFIHILLFNMTWLSEHNVYVLYLNMYIADG